MSRPDTQPEYTYRLSDEYESNTGQGNKGDTLTWKVVAVLLGLTLLVASLSPENRESIRTSILYLPTRAVEAARDGISIVTEMRLVLGIFPKFNSGLTE